MARRRVAERALTAGGRVRPGLRRALSIAAGAVALAALAPRVETLPSDEPAPGPVPAEDAVRVSRGDRTLVYDKREGWLSAKAAEWFPSVVPDVVPADWVEDADGTLRRRRVALRSRW